jgi:hypothetical protein
VVAPGTLFLTPVVTLTPPVGAFFALAFDPPAF